MRRTLFDVLTRSQQRPTSLADVPDHAVQARIGGVADYRGAKDKLCVRLVRKNRSILPLVVAARGLAWISFAPSTAHARSSWEDTNAEPRSTRTPSGMPRAINAGRSAASRPKTSSPDTQRQPTSIR